MPSLTVQNEFLRQSANQDSEFLLDPDGKLELLDAIKQPDRAWSLSLGNAPFFGYSPDHLWVRMNLVNGSDAAKELLLEIAYPLLDQVDLYLLQPDHSNWQEQPAEQYHTGDRYPFNQRPLKTRSYVFPVHLKPGESRQVYFHIHTTSVLGAPLTVWDADHYNEQQQSPLMWQGLYYGIIAVMLLYNLFLYFSIRHISYLYYIGAVLGCSSYVASAQGFGFQFLWPALPWVNTFSVPVSLSLFGLMGCLFATSLLDMKPLAPRLHRLLTLLASGFVVIMVLSFFVSYRTATVLVSFFGMPTTLIVILCGFYMLHLHVRSARFFVLAWTILLASVFITGLNKFGLLPGYFWITHSIQIASAAEVMLFSFALADRIVEIRQQKLIAQQQALDNEKRVQEEQSRVLELKFKSEKSELESRRNLIQAKAENKAKSEFLNSMSHEIRTPLNGVLGMVELMRDTELDNHQQHYLQAISHSGSTLLGIINDILDYDSIAAGKLELHPTNVDLQLLCQECITIFSANPERKSLELFCTFAADTPEFVYADPVRLGQILFNLLGNAIKFTQEGYILLQVSSEASSSPPDHTRLRFDVIDTGLGIHPRIQQKLFNAFSQADPSITREYGGTGLGLNICRKLVSLMGGTIGVISVPQQGSRFWFNIECPLAEADPNAQHNQPVSGKRVLIVGDSMIASQILLDQTRSLGMLSEIARSLEDAMTLSSQATSAFDFVLLDLQVPGSTRVNTIQRLQQLPELQNARFILLGSPTMLPDCAALQELKIEHIAQKPLAPRFLMQTMARKSATDSFGFSQEQSMTRQLIGSGTLSGKSLLVVEDNPVNQMVVAGMLKKLEIECHFAENGQQALDLIGSRETAFDLILMDCEMPVMDGYQATRAIRKLEQRQRRRPVPIIALSAHVLPEHQARASAAGMNDHIAKPMQFVHLIRALQKFLGFDTAQARNG